MAKIILHLMLALAFAGCSPDGKGPDNPALPDTTETPANGSGNGNNNNDNNNGNNNGSSSNDNNSGSDNGSGSGSSSGNGNSSGGGGTNENNQNDNNPTMSNKINITINGSGSTSGTTLTATLVENSSTAALKELLSKGPVAIDMSDYGNFEKVGQLPQSLPRNDEHITTQAGDLILYLGQSFVIYYDTNTYTFTRLGRIDNVSQSELKKILGSGNVSVTISKP